MSKNIVKIEALDKDFTFVPYGQNFKHTIKSGDTLEFATTSAQTLYYEKQVADGSSISIVDHYDGEIEAAIEVQIENGTYDGPGTITTMAEITLTPNDYYDLPDENEITVNGADLYSYDRESGVVVIKNPTEPVVSIVCNCVPVPVPEFGKFIESEQIAEGSYLYVSKENKTPTEINQWLVGLDTEYQEKSGGDNVEVCILLNTTPAGTSGASGVSIGAVREVTEVGGKTVPTGNYAIIAYLSNKQAYTAPTVLYANSEFYISIDSVLTHCLEGWQNIPKYKLAIGNNATITEVNDTKPLSWNGIIFGGAIHTYTITTNIEGGSINGTAPNSITDVYESSAVIRFRANDGHKLPVDIIYEGATCDYAEDEGDGVITITEPSRDVIITINCPSSGSTLTEFSKGLEIDGLEFSETAEKGASSPNMETFIGQCLSMSSSGKTLLKDGSNQTLLSVNQIPNEGLYLRDDAPLYIRNNGWVIDGTTYPTGRLTLSTTFNIPTEPEWNGSLIGAYINK